MPRIQPERGFHLPAGLLQLSLLQEAAAAFQMLVHLRENLAAAEFRRDPVHQTLRLGVSHVDLQGFAQKPLRSLQIVDRNQLLAIGKEPGHGGLLR